MEKKYEIKLQLYDNNGTPTSIQYVMTDRDTMPLHIKLMGKNEPFEIPAGSLAEMNFQQGGVRYMRMAEIEDNAAGKIVYHMTAEDISMPGEITASVTLVTGEMRLTWQEFKFRVVRGLIDGQGEVPSAIEPWQNSVTAKLSAHEVRLEKIESMDHTSSVHIGDTPPVNTDSLWIRLYKS